MLHDIDRGNKEVLHVLEHHGADLLGASYFQQVLLGIAGGSFITLAAGLSAVLATGVSALGPNKLLQGVAFTGG